MSKYRIRVSRNNTGDIYYVPEKKGLFFWSSISESYHGQFHGSEASAKDFIQNYRRTGIIKYIGVN